MFKADIRKTFLTKRKQLTEDQVASASKALLERFKLLDLAKIKSIHLFLPIITKNEPNSFLFVDELSQHHPHIEIIVSKSDFSTHEMVHYHFNGKEDLKENQYKIPEPQNATPFFGIPDMVLVPLLAFDVKGNRVGYGKGFYDRFLSKIETVKIGISLFDEPVEINDVHLSDVRLDFCITPNRIFNFNSPENGTSI